jgi:hypothetical protein
VRKRRPKAHPPEEARTDEQERRVRSMAAAAPSDSVGPPLKTAARRLTWDEDGTSRGEARKEEDAERDEGEADNARTDVAKLAAAAAAHAEERAMLECLVLQLQGEVSALRVAALARESHEKRDDEAAAHSNGPPPEEMGLCLDGAAAGEAASAWIGDEGTEAADRDGDETLAAAEAVMAAADAAVDAAEAQTLAARAAAAAERAVLRSALEVADADCAALNETRSRHEAELKREVAATAHELAACQAQLQNDAVQRESEAAQRECDIEELIAECELAQTMLAAKEDQLAAMRMLLR